MRRITCAIHLMIIMVTTNCFGASLFGNNTGQPPHASERLTGILIIAGASSMSPLIKEIARRFEALHPEASIDVKNVGSFQGIADLREGKIAIGMLPRALTEAERDITSYPIARDGICVIINQDNAISNLSNQQVHDIFVGKIVNWDKAGGHSAPITVINGVAGSGTVDPFIQYFKIKYEEIKAKTILLDGAERLKLVSEDRNAISFSSLGDAERRMKGGSSIKLLPADGVRATASTLRRGNFPIARPFTLITSGAQNVLTKEFIRFALSSSATPVIEMYDFVPYRD